MRGGAGGHEPAPRTADFDYVLPEALIAQTPAARRDAARMMVLHRATGTVEHRTVRDVPDMLRAGDVLVVNDTRVIPARLTGRRAETGGRVELLLIEALPGGGGAGGEALWRALCRMRGRLRPGLRLVLADGELEGELRTVEATGRVQVALWSDAPVAEVLERHGTAPLPPYIRRPRGAGGAEEAAGDRERYQTVYARVPGAVAAPTAGLHFTPDLLERIRRRGVETAAVTLHVGPGTFRPVRSERVDGHRMEAERFEMGAAAARAVQAARERGGRVVAVGTTTVRTLEAAGAAERGGAAGGRTDLFIYPPYTFRSVDALLTNFHLPRSTLLMLVSAFAAPGERERGRTLILAAYREAVRAGYRFYSYGDCRAIEAQRVRRKPK
ncbi:MAG: tRNA preQ1(34) S-adenosylmethionine ribosyltransferase-isomerase QueA [Lentisphaerae bacterium]|nr:tRNA preQ1(34) S-adenosylmethionine ribosyltransferase-isomerase QueA [Lentisphaerota bacterium]